MNRDYIEWLESLPCNRKPQKVNVWMGGWAPLPEEIDLADCEAWQNREIQRNHNGFVARLWRWVRRCEGDFHSEFALNEPEIPVCKRRSQFH